MYGILLLQLCSVNHQAIINFTSKTIFYSNFFCIVILKGSTSKSLIHKPASYELKLDKLFDTHGFNHTLSQTKAFISPGP